ncbi:transposase, partial [Akkermansiaceae bacterium]|nr:transposase [Akkermansiaceae bacterium]MDA7888216.1 transposase [Akkermansiaceae bacterium]MDB4537471.1 transposase [Akkermansiaceae bacterium]
MNEQTKDNSESSLLNLIFEEGLQEALPRIAEILLNAAMLIERERHIGVAPHQRGGERNGYANGFKPRTFQTGVGALNLAVPQVRDSQDPFRTSLLEKGSRSDKALKSAIATMYIEGVSTRRVTKIMEQMCGFEVSSGQVSNLNKQLDEEFEKWRTRPLPEIAYMTLDATYYKVRIDCTVRDCATLIAHGVRRSDGKRMILGVSCALSEAEVHWREFLTGLKERGMGIPDLITSDAHSGLKADSKRPSKHLSTQAPGSVANFTFNRMPRTTSPSKNSRAPLPARSKRSSTPTLMSTPKSGFGPSSKSGKMTNQSSLLGLKKTSLKASASLPFRRPTGGG